LEVTRLGEQLTIEQFNAALANLEQLHILHMKLLDNEKVFRSTIGQQQSPKKLPSIKLLQMEFRVKPVQLPQVQLPEQLQLLSS